MGKISRTTLSPKETLPEPINSSQVQAWSLSTQNNFVRCVSLLDQIKSQQLNIVDNTNIVLISYSLALFGDSGKKLFLEICLFQNEFESARLEEVWNQAILKSIYKTPEKFIKLCKDKGLQIKLNDAEGWEYKIRRWGQNARDFTDDLTEDDV